MDKENVLVVDSVGNLWLGQNLGDPSQPLARLRNARMVYPPNTLRQELAASVAVEISLRGISGLRSSGEPVKTVGPTMLCAWIAATHLFSTTQEIADEVSALPLWGEWRTKYPKR